MVYRVSSTRAGRPMMSENDRKREGGRVRGREVGREGKRKEGRVRGRVSRAEQSKLR